MAPLEGLKSLIGEVENGARARELFRLKPSGLGSSLREATLIAGVPFGASRRDVVTTTLTELRIVTVTPAVVLGTRLHGDPDFTNVMRPGHAQAPNTNPGPILITTEVSPRPSDPPAPAPDRPLPTQPVQTRTIITQPLKTNLPDHSSPVHDEAPATKPTPSAVFAGNGDIGDASKAFTSVEITTTFVTEGVFTTDVTRTLPNGSVEVFTITTSGTRTLTTTTEVASQIATVSSNSGPPKAIIGGVIGATVIVVLALVAFYILKRKRKRFQRANEVAPASVVAHPFTGSDRTNSPAKYADTRGLPTTNSPHSSSPSFFRNISHENGNNTSSEEPKDPFRDPEPLDEPHLPETGVPEAGNALDRLRTLTTQLEAEFRRLSFLARSDQLSEADRARLDEIKHIVSSTTSANPRDGRVSLTSTTSTTTTYSSPPPSYRSNGSQRDNI